VTTEAAVGQAEWTLAQRTVTSRIEGRVEAVYHRKGEFVSAGSPILSVLPEDGVKVRFFVPQSLVGSLQTGGFVSVSVGAISGEESAEMRATISFVATEAEFTPPVIYSVDSREKLVFMVEARLPIGSALRPGIPVDIRLSADRP
jgi:HlyD family secretion protein